jgi:hypothetical protein
MGPRLSRVVCMFAFMYSRVMSGSTIWLPKGNFHVVFNKVLTNLHKIRVNLGEKSNNLLNLIAPMVFHLTSLSWCRWRWTPLSCSSGSIQSELAGGSKNVYSDCEREAYVTLKCSSATWHLCCGVCHTNAGKIILCLNYINLQCSCYQYGYFWLNQLQSVWLSCSFMQDSIVICILNLDMHYAYDFLSQSKKRFLQYGIFVLHASLICG